MVLTILLNEGRIIGSSHQPDVMTFKYFYEFHTVLLTFHKNAVKFGSDGNWLMQSLSILQCFQHILSWLAVIRMSTERHQLPNCYTCMEKKQPRLLNDCGRLGSCVKIGSFSEKYSSHSI